MYDKTALYDKMYSDILGIPIANVNMLHLRSGLFVKFGIGNFLMALISEIQAYLHLLDRNIDLQPRIPSTFINLTIEISPKYISNYIYIISLFPAILYDLFNLILKVHVSMQAHAIGYILTCMCP